MHEGSANLEKVESKVDSNSASIQTLRDSVITLEARNGQAVMSHANSTETSSDGTSFAEALAKQTQFNMTLSL